MRKPKGKLVALLAGAVAVVLVAVGVMFWKDVYCHLFLDPRLVGRWESISSGRPPDWFEASTSFVELPNPHVDGSIHPIDGSRRRTSSFFCLLGCRDLP